MMIGYPNKEDYELNIINLHSSFSPDSFLIKSCISLSLLKVKSSGFPDVIIFELLSYNTLLNTMI